MPRDDVEEELKVWGGGVLFTEFPDLEWFGAGINTKSFDAHKTAPERKSSIRTQTTNNNTVIDES